MTHNRVPITQLLLLYLNSSNSTAPLKYICFYYVYIATLLKYLGGYSKVTVELL